MPFKFHASRRHKFAKLHHRVTNWGEYNESLRRRADITVWLDESVVHRWGMARTGKPLIVSTGIATAEDDQADILILPSLSACRYGPFSICLCGKPRGFCGRFLG